MTKELLELLEGLRSKDWWNRYKVTTELIKHPEEEYIDFLENALRNNEDANIRNAAIEIYKALGSRAFPSIFSLIKDDDHEVRLFSVNILGQIGNKEVMPHLFRTINDPDENVRVASAEALGMIGDESALHALKKTLDDELWVAMAGLQAIGEIGGEEALSIIYDCLEKEEYQDFAITAIAKAGNKHSIKYLTKFLDKTDHVFNKELALEAIVKIAERERVRLRPENFRNFIPIIIETLNSPDFEMKKSAFIALCWSEDINGLPYFIEAIKDNELQEYAIDGLLSIGRKAAPAIVESLKNSDGNHRKILAKVLSMLGENEALLEFKKDENPEVRVEVALALGSVKSATYVRALLKMLSDPYEEVRLAARKSLDNINKRE